MADTTLATGLTVQQWLDRYFVEYLTENRYSESMGPNENSVFHVKEELTKKAGDSITFPLVNKLSGAAVTGSSTLEGNEEAMGTRSFRLYIDKRRNAVRIPEMETVKTEVDLLDAAKAVLKDWSMKDTEGLITTALGSINGVAYGAATETQKDAWLVDNADRVLFGASKSNNAANDHSASLANIDNTADKLTPAAISLMKRIALTANPKIRPIRVEGTAGRRFYVAYANPLSFRDLKDNATIQQAQREVGLQMENNRLFQGGDILWDGVIVKEVEDIDILTGVGATAIDVGPVYLCGAQAVGVAYGKRWKNIREDFDYGDKKGVGVEAIYGVSKMQFGSGASDTADLKDHGVVTGFFAAVADA